MRYSISLPNFGDLADPRLHAGIAREAEDAGWDGYFVWDHLLVWNGNVVADPWAILTAVALATERLRLGPMLVPLPRRRPWNVVRQIVTLDHLSGGRAVLGAGLGFPPHEEFEVFGEPSDAKVRAALLDEGLEVVAGLMTGEPLSFRGEHVRIDDVTFAPPPVQRPRVPIWIGGAWPRRAPFRRAARWDGVVPIALDEDGEEILPTVDDQRAILAYTLEHRISDRPFDAVFTGWMPDDPAEGADAAAELASFGVTWWQTSIGWPEESLGEFRERIRRGPPGR
ncbi:MAG TPA: LLM class flavin-dependent oxidoreductase [Actinomycetota bacterium]|nr:LLM class flavin-dependent oxidoreductase [Actinomycetota bacterium]